MLFYSRSILLYAPIGATPRIRGVATPMLNANKSYYHHISIFINTSSTSYTNIYFKMLATNTVISLLPCIVGTVTTLTLVILTSTYGLRYKFIYNDMHYIFYIMSYIIIYIYMYG